MLLSKVHLRAETVTKLSEVDLVSSPGVESIHKTQDFALSRIEAILSKKVSQFTRANVFITILIYHVEGSFEIFLQFACNLGTNVFHLAFCIEN